MKTSTKIYLIALLLFLLSNIAIYGYVFYSMKLANFSYPTQPQNLERITNMDFPDAVTDEYHDYVGWNEDADWYQSIIFNEPISEKEWRKIQKKCLKLSIIDFTQLSCFFPNWFVEYDVMGEPSSYHYYTPICFIEGRFYGCFCQISQYGASIDYDAVWGLVILFFISIFSSIIFLLWGVILFIIYLINKYRNTKTILQERYTI